MATSVPAHQQEILDACSTGAIEVLKELLKSHGINQGTAPILHRDVTESGCPSTGAMLSAAISSKQAAAVRFLLDEFSGYPADWSDAQRRSARPISLGSGEVQAVLESPDIEILQVLLDYDHDVVSYEFDDHTTFLSQACQRDPDEIGPLIRLLVAHGADMQAGWRWNWDLLPAIRGGQHLDVLKAMIAKGAKLDYSAMLTAVRVGRADVLRMALEQGGARVSRLSDADIESLREAAKVVDDVLIMKLVETISSAT
ncbi:hypothetical protein VPNG_10233 [Cytospora leucostoma]|uniref:Uncharacterized protein n=1 Tax=Cytospora leucostoma TaxID=1230097 RepID=A0A423VCD5_9PEZI|nr:hypothetical protein VPNG_10233 [Cytospora leucostoma]